MLNKQQKIFLSIGIIALIGAYLFNENYYEPVWVSFDENGEPSELLMKRKILMPIKRVIDLTQNNMGKDFVVLKEADKTTITTKRGKAFVIRNESWYEERKLNPIMAI
jgi:hypothetical protein